LTTTPPNWYNQLRGDTAAGRHPVLLPVHGRRGARAAPRRARGRGGARGARLRPQGHGDVPLDGRRPPRDRRGLEDRDGRDLRGHPRRSPFKLPTDAWWTWVALFFADDLAFYCYHRGHHRIRLFWATHVVHHSSQHYNFSTALRQDWTPFSATLFWAPSALFFPPWMVLLALAWNLLFQFLLHTEAIDRLPRPIELVFNTPSHHRVHHGSQEQYLDKNYGGILIVWDRLFGTFEPEGARVRYGLTTNIETHNPVRVAFGEFGALWRDVRAARSWRDRLGYAVKGPGWAPATAPEPDATAEPAGQSPPDPSSTEGIAVLRGSAMGSPL
jgi:hypothetical protein